MNNLVSFLKNEKLNNEENINKLNTLINKMEYDIENIDKKIVEFTKNIDTTYEIFSPNSYDKDYNVVEINKLNKKKQELKENIEKFSSNKKKLINRQKNIELAIDDLDNLRNSLNKNVEETKELIQNQEEKYYKFYSEEITFTLEKQINKDNNIVNKTVSEKLDYLKNKIDLCKNFCDMDVNRAKMEILKLDNDLLSIKKDLNTKMFHVKHFELNNLLYINEEIKSFINQFKKTIDCKIDYKYTGDKIKEKSSNILNIIRIIQESVNNSVSHSKCSKITINLIVEKYMDIISNADTNNEESDDICQINFVIEEPKQKYIIIVKITDDGHGFEIQNDNIYMSNNMYGIVLMKYRAEKLSGKFNIQSTKGFGTAVTLEYETEM